MLSKLVHGIVVKHATETLSRQPEEHNQRMEVIVSPL